MLTIGKFICMLAESGRFAAGEVRNASRGCQRMVSVDSEKDTESEKKVSVGAEAARAAGWAEEQDVIGADGELDRRTAARIIHTYIRTVLKLPDLKDISEAYDLRDIFDCRVCANHIAQVVLRKIMDPVEVGNMHIFDVFGKVTSNEADLYIRRITEISQKEDTILHTDCSVSKETPSLMSHGVK